MPVLRRYKPSVAPVDMTGITGTPGHICSVIRSTAPRTSGLSGDGSAATAAAIEDTVILESSKTRTSVERTSVGESPGTIRQLTTARAIWGSAFSACPPSRRVATHVVLRSALSKGDLDNREAAARS